jgi:hypothetical protein
MTRRCKCGCLDELLPAAKCTDIVSKKGYASIECLARHTRIKEAAKKDKVIKDRNIAFKKEVNNNDRSGLAKKAQAAFNSFIRERDKDLACISCGRHHQGQYHAGHYRSVGAAKQLRFNEINCHKQCAPCNNHKSGNITEYRINLIKKIGVDNTEALENNNEVKRYSVVEYKEIAELYKLKLRELKKRGV